MILGGSPYPYFTNYRPISLLSNFSKFFERVMHNRITNFLDRLDILYFAEFNMSSLYKLADQVL